MYKKYTNKRGVPKGYVRQILLIMRLTTIILIMAIMQVSASTFAQRITLSEKNVTLSRVFDRISDQCGYDFVFNSDLLKVTKPVTISVKNTELDKVLEQIFAGQPLSFSIEDKTVVVKAKQRGFFENVLDNIRAIDVRGKVLDEKGEPLVGATVAVKGKNRSVKTDQNGAFFLDNVGENDKLVISFIGYQNREVDAASDMGSLTMVVADADLEEVKINAGYYSVTDRERTGSISRVTSEDIAKQPISNPLQSLQNRVAGVEVIQQTGIAGGGFSVKIRGRNSIASGTDPLYIIDGVIFPSLKLNTLNSDIILNGGANPLSLINPSDIQSIEILKDADATSIYGSRGSNGVILVTTKKGNQGELKISADYSQGINNVGHKIELLNTEQYLQMREEALKNDGLSPGPTDYDLNGMWDRNNYTDWQDKLMGKTAQTRMASISLASGTDRGSYILGGNYYNEGSVIGDAFGFRRGGLLANVILNSKDGKFSAGFNSVLTISNNKTPLYDPTGDIFFAPNAPETHDKNGKLNWKNFSANPASTLLNNIQLNSENIISNLNLTYNFLEKLSMKVSFGYNSIKSEEHSKLLNASINPDFNPNSDLGQSQFGNNYSKSWIVEPQLDFNQNFLGGKIEALLGMSFQDNSTRYKNVLASNFTSDELMNNIGSAGLLIPGESRFFRYKYAATYARVNYSLSDKYYLNLTGRRDGSSRFGPGKQFANFGAIGAAWIFTEENFLSNSLPFITFGKVRASYGLTGNDQIADYGFLQLYESSLPYQGVPTLITNRISNIDFAWETNSKIEAAIEFKLFDKVNFNVAHFRNWSSNQLVYIFPPPSAGASFIQGNLPAKVRNSGWEIESQVDIIKSKTFNWTMGLNLTVPKNKLVSYPDFNYSVYATQFIIGEPLTINRHFNVSVNKETGFYEAEDKNNNGIIEADGDLYLSKFVGQFYYGGVHNTLSFKQFSLDFLISFSKQNGRSMMSANTLNPGFFMNGTSSNKSIEVLDRWQSHGDESKYSKFSTSFTSLINGFLVDQGGQKIEDASFARLKNASLNYTFPQKLITRLRIKDLKMSLLGQNIFTLTKYKGLDPEYTEYTKIPPLRAIAVKLNITF